MKHFGLFTLFCVVLASCSTSETVESSQTASSTLVEATIEEATVADDDVAERDAAFPDVLAAEATLEDAGTWRFNVTLSSPYDTPERYADAWRVIGPDGTEYGVRILTHDHASEQPFTRSQGGIEIPADVASVTIEGRDLLNGWGGGRLELDLP